jgi:hypothetical protein
LQKQQLVRKGLLQRAKNHYQRRVVLIETVFWKCIQKSARMVSDKKTLLAEANASAKRNLISVGGCTDTSVHVDAAGNADGKRPCLGNGQTEGHGWGRFVGGTWIGVSRRISGQ